MSQRNIERFVKIVIVATFFVPLIMAPASFIFPFIVPKIVVFRSLVMLMLGGLLILLAANRRAYEVRMTPVTLAIFLFLLSFAMSTFVGVDWYHSFWDNHERMLGLFTILHYVIYFLVVTTVIKEWRDWVWLLRLFLFAGSIVMFIGVMQRFNPTMLLNQSGSRVAATLGNPIYVGGYGLFLSFVGLFLAVKEKTRQWRMFAMFGGILGFIGIFLSGTRGAMLGWIAGMGTVLLSYLFLLKGHERARKTMLGFTAICVVLLGIFYAFRQTEFVQKIPALGALLNTSVGSGTASTRLMAWSIAIDAWKERPIFGWGPNNFFYAFNKYYQPEFLEHGWGETWFDNAHNIIINTLAVQGIVGVALYLGMYSVVIFFLWRAYQRRTIDMHAAVILCGFFVAHLIGNVFVFENPTSYLYFFFMMAFANSLMTYGIREHMPAKEGDRPVSVGVSAVVGIVIFLLIFSTNVNPARANRATLKALRSLYSLSDPVGTYQQTIAIPSPHIDDIRNDFARTVQSVVPEYVKNGQPELAKQLLILAFDELNKNRTLHPLDIRVHLQQAQLAETGAILFQSAELLLHAEAALSDALTKSPRRQQVQFTLAANKLQLRKFDEAIAIMRQAVENDPKIGESWWRLALVLQEAKRTEEAMATVREARARGIVFDARGLEITNAILPPEPATGTK